ncbi:unnamed protein product [Parnassius mnemosyne]|uniref:F-box domain-containing protein n=1 Tax=Parnassius mnemosyne TaxID=213953 RepID=A0AAV1LHT5_9NEOP
MAQNILINDLPLEIFIKILKEVDGVSLGKCRRVCKKWRDGIDGSDQIWHEVCRKEFKHSSEIAKRKAGNICRWYHIYKNLKMWIDITTFDKKVREFYKFSLHDKSHALDVDYGVLPLKDAKGVVFYDMSNLKYIPVAISETNCCKVTNNDHVSVILTKTGLYVQKCVDSNGVTEGFFKAENFVLSGEVIYFHNGTRAGELLLYRLSSQKKGPMSRPIFDTLAILPEGKFAVQLDVCERKNGPLIIASTFFEIILVEYDFFPHEQEPKCSFPVNKLTMYKRLLRLKDRLQSS